MKTLLIGLFFCLFTASAVAAKAPARASASGQAQQIRVLVALGPSTFFFRDGKPHGVEYAWLLEYEKYANEARKDGQKIKLRFIPVDPGELIPALYEGRGDMAAGMIPYSEGLRQLVGATDPYLSDQWCVFGKKDATLAQTEDELVEANLLLPPSSYANRLLVDVNEARRAIGLAEITPKEAAPGVTAEKRLSQIHRGDSVQVLGSRFVATLWGRIFTKLKAGVCLDTPASLVWAVHKDNPVLLADLNRFIAEKRPQWFQRGIDLTRTYLHPDGVGKPSQSIDPFDKLAFFAPIFQLAAAANDLDWLLLAAIGQRETGLSAVKSKSGPTGVMQVSPSTARMMGIKNPHETDSNVTAAARYLSRLREMFNTPAIAPDDQLYFMLAAYNAGEGRLQGLRKKAAEQGLDPNRWHGHVELIAQRSEGRRMVDYVSAVSRYYLAYQSAERKRMQDVAASAPAKNTVLP